MQRTVIAAVAAAIFTSGAVQAQNTSGFNRPVWGPRVRITPFVGFAPIASRYEYWTVAGPGGTASGEFDVNLAGGPAAGIALELKAVERFAIVASAAYVSRGRTTEQSIEDELVIEHEGSNFVLAKVGIAIRLREQVSELQMHTVSGTVFAGPAWIREMPKEDPFASAALLEPLTHYGFSFGFDAEVPLPYSGVSVTGGMEDFVVWWNDVELARRNDAVFAENGFETMSTVATNPTHMLVLRGGLSFRF